MIISFERRPNYKVGIYFSYHVYDGVLDDVFHDDHGLQINNKKQGLTIFIKIIKLPTAIKNIKYILSPCLW